RAAAAESRARRGCLAPGGGSYGNGTLVASPPPNLVGAAPSNPAASAFRRKFPRSHSHKHRIVRIRDVVIRVTELCFSQPVQKCDGRLHIAEHVDVHSASKRALGEDARAGGRHAPEVATYSVLGAQHAAGGDRG